jgi:hypothetical protein
MVFQMVALSIRLLLVGYEMRFVKRTTVTAMVFTTISMKQGHPPWIIVADKF